MPFSRIRSLLLAIILLCITTAVFPAQMIYMDEDFEGAEVFKDLGFPIRNETTTPTLPLAQGINIRCGSGDSAATRVQLALNTGSVATNRAYQGWHCYSLRSSETLSIAPGSIGNNNTENVRVWQFAISADSASVALSSGTVIGRYTLHYSTDSQSNSAPEVSVVLEVVKNAAGSFSVLCRNNNALLGKLSGAKTSWLLITLIAAQKVTYVERADDFIAWGAYDPFLQIHKGPQPVQGDKSVLPAGIHLFADMMDQDAILPTVRTTLTRAKELGPNWGYVNGDEGASHSRELGWSFEGLNGGRIYVDNLYWAAEGHGSWTNLLDQDQAARMEPFAQSWSNPLPPSILQPHQTGVFDNDIIFSGNGTRHFRTVVPPGYRPGRPIGILFGFQGAGPPFRSHLIGTGFESLADQAYYIAVTPANGGGSFNSDENPDNPDVLLVHNILNRLRSLYTIDENRIFCTGFSNGGAFASTVARHPDLVPLAVTNPCEPVKAHAPVPEAKTAAIIFGGSTDQYATLQDVDNFIGWSKQLQRDGAFYSFNIPHTYPKLDTLTNPPLAWAQKAVRYFNTHPLNYQTQAYPPPSYGISFRDDFNTVSSTESLTTPPWISVLSADTRGRFGDLWGLRFLKREGRLATESIAPNPHSSTTICAFAFTDFLRKGFQWETAFRMDNAGTATLVYPCLLRDMKGRMIALTLSPSQSAWILCPDQLTFHADITSRTTTLTASAIALQTGQQYRVKVLYDPPALSWQIHNEADTIIDAGAIPAGALPPGFDYMPDAEAGIGVRALPAESVSFDFVRANVPSAVEPEHWSAY